MRAGRARGKGPDRDHVVKTPFVGKARGFRAGLVAAYEDFAQEHLGNARGRLGRVGVVFNVDDKAFEKLGHPAAHFFFEKCTVALAEGRADVVVGAKGQSLTAQPVADLFGYFHFVWNARLCPAPARDAIASLASCRLRTRRGSLGLSAARFGKNYGMRGILQQAGPAVGFSPRKG